VDDKNHCSHGDYQSENFGCFVQNLNRLQSQVTHPGIKTSHKRGIVALQISIREYRDVYILDLQGRSTINNGESEFLSEHLRELTSTGKRKLLLNLADLLQIDSSGVCIIVEMYVSLKRCGGELKLLSPRGRVLDVLTVCRLLDVIPSFEDEIEALASFRPQGFFATP
jgi:anti-anti-sigma factor